MTDHRRQNRRLWEEWSDDFQALWNAETGGGDLPPTPCPFDEDTPGGPQPGVVETVAGKDVVELGCGGGQASVGTARHGADTVVGVDLSPAQLAHARKLGDLYGVDAHFVAGDVTDLPLADDSFDVAFSGWVYQMVADLEAALREARRVLREDGVLIFDRPHPFYELFDESSGTIERPYFETGRREITIDEDFDADLVVFDRTVGDVHRAAVEAGFEVRRLLEVQAPETDGEDPDDGGLPELLWQVPKSLRLWAVVR